MQLQVEQLGQRPPDDWRGAAGAFQQQPRLPFVANDAARIFTICSARCWLSWPAGEVSAVTSSTAFRRPWSSQTGAAVQVSGMWVASKWSLRCTVSAWRVAIQLPTPQVPA